MENLNSIVVTFVVTTFVLSALALTIWLTVKSRSKSRRFTWPHSPLTKRQIAVRRVVTISALITVISLALWGFFPSLLILPAITFVSLNLSLYYPRFATA